MAAETDLVEISVPLLPESVSNATVATWHKQPGESLLRDEPLVDIETDKVVLEVVAPSDGTLIDIVKKTGDVVVAKACLGHFRAGAVVATPLAAPSITPPLSPTSTPAPKLIAVPPSTSPITERISPAIRRLIGEGGESKNTHGTAQRTEHRERMTPIRQRIAQRLSEAQQSAVILTTFNEVNMQPIMAMRTRYKDPFEKIHGVKLGFMSFFTLAVVEALKKFPQLNASIEGSDLVYHDYYDIAIAVSTERGLVVPVLRDVQNMSMAGIEKQINLLADKAREKRLTLEEMSGGTFTISNGGVFGSLLSTPILNPPQSGILGMHKIEERAVVEKGQIVIKPMMYLALSYDHRIVDGKDSVQFLVAIKNYLEDPVQILLGI